MDGDDVNGIGKTNKGFRKKICSYLIASVAGGRNLSLLRTKTK
jgi:hypothetical protein